MTGKYRQGVIPVVAAVLLSACGGGSSGPAPIQEPPAPIVTYTGNRQPILVTQSNAAQLASRAFSLRHITQSLESLWVDAPFGQNDSERTTAGRYSGRECGQWAHAQAWLPGKDARAVQPRRRW